MTWPHFIGAELNPGALEALASIQDSQPFAIINLLKYKERATYPPGTVREMLTDVEAQKRESGSSKDLASLGDKLTSELQDLDKTLTDGLTELKKTLEDGYQGDQDELNQAIEDFRNSMDEGISQVVSSLSDTIGGIFGNLKDPKKSRSSDSEESSVQDTVKHLDGIGSKLKRLRR